MKYEFSFVIPCLNEEKSIKYVIEEIQQYINKNELNAEILISDNGSNDNSVSIAKKCGVRVSTCNNKGYGNVLINGTNNAYRKILYNGRL